MRIGRLGLAAILTLMLGATVWADVTLPNIFSDHMVLQQQQKNRVWGQAAPGETVTVSINGENYTKQSLTYTYI